MSFRKFNCFILFISTFLGSCTFFQDQDEELLPAELVKYDELLNIKKVWGKGIGKGSEQLHLSLKPSGNSEVIYTASHDGKVSSIEAVSGRVFWRKDLITNLTPLFKFITNLVISTSVIGSFFSPLAISFLK